MSHRVGPAWFPVVGHAGSLARPCWSYAASRRERRRPAVQTSLAHGVLSRCASSANSPRMPMDEALDAGAWMRRRAWWCWLTAPTTQAAALRAIQHLHPARALLDRGVQRCRAGHDLGSASRGHRGLSAGVGARLSMRIGGKVGPMSGDAARCGCAGALPARLDATQAGLVPGSRDPLGAAVALRMCKGWTWS